MKERSKNFMTEFIALCERHGAAVLTDGPTPHVIFADRKNVAQYIKWWIDNGVCVESKDFEDYL
jgi:hypothetical protein